MEATAAVLKTIFKVASRIYDQCEQAKTNKKLCDRLHKRVRMLMRVLDKLERQPEKAAELAEALEEFQSNLENAETWVRTYSDQGWWKKLLLANGMYKKFLHINDQLGDTAEAIQVLLLVEKREAFVCWFRKNSWKSLDEDITNLIALLESEMKTMGDKVDSVKEEVKNLKQLSIAFKPCDISEIPAGDLKRRRHLAESDKYSFHIGEFNLGLVLIKDLKGQLNMDNEYVRKTFQSECKVMTIYAQSPNIIKLIGICIYESDTGPSYSVVTEYCEKGALRDVLYREPDLEWDVRLAMALDAARAMYWIHHAKNKSTLHGDLNSCKYLVTASNCLKLSGFEFSKTETSMRRNKAKRSEENQEWAYCAPETLQSINAYDMRSEIYSLGIVIYEIATGPPPLQGRSKADGSLAVKSIYQMVIAEVSAHLPDTCPSILRCIIQKSLQEDPWARPTAREITNWLVTYDGEQWAPPMDTTQ